MSKRTHGAQPGHKRWAGRAKGSKNKATIEKERIAAEIAKRRAIGAFETGRELGIDKLERYSKTGEGTTERFRREIESLEQEISQTPPTDVELIRSLKEDLRYARGEMREWFRIMVWVGELLTQRQTPKLSAIAIAPPPQVIENERAKAFTLTIFEGGRGLPKPILELETDDEEEDMRSGLRNSQQS